MNWTNMPAFVQSDSASPNRFSFPEKWLICLLTGFPSLLRFFSSFPNHLFRRSESCSDSERFFLNFWTELNRFFQWRGRVRLISPTNEMLRHNPHSNAIGLRYSPPLRAETISFLVRIVFSTNHWLNRFIQKHFHKLIQKQPDLWLNLQTCRVAVRMRLRLLVFSWRLM